MIKDYFRFALEGIMHRKKRSFLTVIGIVIGIFAVVALISLGQGMQNAIDEQFKVIGSNRIIITPGGGGMGENSNPFMSGLSSAKLYDRDVDLIIKARGVDYASGAIISSGKVEFKNKAKYVMVFGIPTDKKSEDFLKKIDFFGISEGRSLRSGDKYKATVGPDFGKKYFGRGIKIGDKINFEGKEFEIVGIHKKTGNPVHDIKISVPIGTLREFFSKPDELSSIFVTVKDGFKTIDAAEEIKLELRKDRGLKEGEEDFSVSTAEQMISMFKDILGVIQIALIGIASISLIVGSIGIMSTMYTSVLERTREIGIMKAVGAKNSDIIMIFIIESGILGLLGGIIGTILGLGVSKGVELGAAMNGFEILKAYVSIELIAGTLAFSFIVGVISGLIPARRGSKMKVVDALRRR